MEVGFIRERQRAGIDAAKARGVYKGRPVTLGHAKIIDLHKKGNGATAIARTMAMLSWRRLQGVRPRLKRVWVPTPPAREGVEVANGARANNHHYFAQPVLENTSLVRRTGSPKSGLRHTCERRLCSRNRSSNPTSNSSERAQESTISLGWPRLRKPFYGSNCAATPIAKNATTSSQ